MNVIEVKDLSKDYRQHFWTPVRRVVDSVSFSVQKGEVFGFLGPNGSGKSTTIKILLEIIFPTEGAASLFGLPIGNYAAKAKIGFLPENPYFYDYLTTNQFLDFHGRLMGMNQKALPKRICEILELVGMRGTEKMYLRNFSKGMLQRIGLAQAILHDPDLIILDEPMTGLDPVGRKEVRDLMLLLRDKGKTIFFSTHILSDVETVCNRVAILNKGRLLKIGSLQDLISVDTKYVDMVWTGRSEGLFSALKPLGTTCSSMGDVLYLKIEPRMDESPDIFEARINEIVRVGHKSGGSLQSLSPKKESLEDVFVKQVGVLESRV